MPSAKLNSDATSQKILTGFIPFNLFRSMQPLYFRFLTSISTVTDKDILEKVREQHRLADTFRVRGEEVALLRLKNIPPQMGRPGYIIRRQSSIREEETNSKI
jgi:hypothetical protein